MVGNPYPEYRDLALDQLATAVLCSTDADWARAGLQRIIQSGLDQEGVTFTYDLPIAILQEAESRNVALAELRNHLEPIMRGQQDPYESMTRVDLARAGAHYHQGDMANALARLDQAERRPRGYPGFASAVLLALLSRYIMLGHDMAQDAKLSWLLAAAGERAERVRDPQFRAARHRLVAEYTGWVRSPVLGFREAETRLAQMPDRGSRRAFKDFVIAAWTAEGTGAAREALKKLLPLTLMDATQLDNALARLVGTCLPALTDPDLERAAAVCLRSLVTAQAWAPQQ
jgi:hypothetical protein